MKIGIYIIVTNSVAGISVHFHGGHKVTPKRSPLFIFFVFNTGYVKFCTNIDLLIPKNHTFFVFQISHILAGKWHNRFGAKFFSLPFATFDDRFLNSTPQRSWIWKKYLKYVNPIKSYRVLKFVFSAILLLKIAQNGEKFKVRCTITFDWIANCEEKNNLGAKSVTSFSRQNLWNLKNKKHTIFWNDEFYICAKFHVACIRTKKVNEGERFGVTLCPPCFSFS